MALGYRAKVLTSRNSTGSSATGSLQCFPRSVLFRCRLLGLIAGIEVPFLLLVGHEARGPRIWLNRDEGEWYRNARHQTAQNPGYQAIDWICGLASTPITSAATTTTMNDDTIVVHTEVKKSRQRTQRLPLLAGQHMSNPPHMTTPMACLLFFAMWPLALLLLVIAPYRVGLVLQGKAHANGFPADTPHGPDWYRRVLRAHANTLETLPSFAVLVFLGAWLQQHTGPFATAAVVVAVTRIGQTLAHISSGRARVVLVRFTFFAVQMAALVTMAVLLLLDNKGLD
jgi:uncharacterized MAPEG superfamily protein